MRTEVVFSPRPALALIMSVPEAPPPSCPTCKHQLNPQTDILWDHTPQTRFGGVTVVYCGWCGTVLGSASHQVFVKKRRG
jgi:phage FluMu protein Com